MADDSPTPGQIAALLDRNFRATAAQRLTMKVRRLLVHRDPSVDQFNYTGILLPAPFQNTNLALRVMNGEPEKVVDHYKSRLSSNEPNISTIPLTTKTEINATAEKLAGEQERFDNQMWVENGGKDALERLAYAMTLGGVGYVCTMPRDAGFGLPDRLYYADLTDDDVERMKREGLITRTKVKEPKTGEMVYAEPGDVWAARRKEVAQQRAISGRGLFTMQAYPRDMVLCERDIDSNTIGPKWAAIIEEIPSDAINEGSDLAQSWAQTNRKPPDDWSLYGLFTYKGRIIGGITNGGPPQSDWQRQDIYTLIRFYTRTEYIILVAPQGQIDGAEIVWRGEHGCAIQGVPACPVDEVPFFRADTDVPGHDFSTPVSRVFALVPLVNQIMTVESNAAMFNGIPRWVIELQNGTTMRGDDGQPVMVHSGQVPGLDPSQAAAYPGTLKQLTIDTRDLVKLLEMYFARLDAAMPAPVTMGASGTSGAAWTASLLINQAQFDLIEPARNICDSVTRIIQRWHGWMRTLDVPVYFYAAPGHRKNKRVQRNLIEFDPHDFTDSIQTSMDLDTPEEATVRLQQGIELLTGGPGGTSLITMEEFYEKYAKSQDARQSVIDYYVEQVVKYVVGGVPAAPGSVIQIVADAVRGRLYYELIQQSPNFAVQQAENIVAQAQQQPMLQGGQQPGQPQGGPPQPEQGQGGNVAEAAGVRRPGMGLAPTLQDQLGGRVPQNGGVAVNA